MVVANPDNHSTVAQNLVAMLSQDTSSNEAQLSLTLASSWVGQIALKPAQHRVQVIATFPNTVNNGTRSI